MTDLPLIHPDRRDVVNFQPVKALKHFRKLVEDKEDTEQVFHIIRALNGRNFVRQADSFWKNRRGKAILANEKSLIERLDNHDALRKYPLGGLAHAYCDFMESEGLTAQGLADEYEKFADHHDRRDDLLERYSNRLRDTHDLFHVLTGYGRDPLGEQALLGFSYSQNGNLGVLFIAYAGGREIKKDLPSSIPVFAAIREGQRHGKMAEKIAHADVGALLKLPLEEARAQLNIKPPETYNRALDMMRADGLNPYDLLENEQMAAV